MAFAGPAFVLGLAAAAWLDLRERRIPNPLTASLGLGGLVAAAMAHGWSGLAVAGSGALCGGVALAVPWRRGWLGGGDLKLAAAMGAWLGPASIAVAVAGGFVIGALVALLFLLADGALRRDVVVNFATALTEARLPAAPLRPRRQTVPLGAAMALAAALLVHLQGLP
jgi:prepilin peptidase CpaA